VIIINIFSGGWDGFKYIMKVGLVAEHVLPYKAKKYNFKIVENWYGSTF
jgi:hypothetical protein